MRQKLQPLFNAGRMDLRTGQFKRDLIGWSHWCPGCETFHVIKLDSGWELLPRNISLPYNPDDDLPTFVGPPVQGIMQYMPGHGLPCVYRIVRGEIIYAALSYHELGGKHLPLPLWDLNDLLPRKPKPPKRSPYVAVTNWLRNLCRSLSSRPL